MLVKSCQLPLHQSTQPSGINMLVLSLWLKGLYLLMISKKFAMLFCCDLQSDDADAREMFARTIYCTNIDKKVCCPTLMLPLVFG